MSTVLPLGTTVCRDCRLPVAIVRRTVEVPCGGCDLGLRGCEHPDDPIHTHALPDLAWAVVDADGERHACRVAA